jgi:polyphosphate glucokinase
MRNTTYDEKILVIDIGGTFTKAIVLDPEGEPIENYKKVETPNPATPKKLLIAIKSLVSEFQNYDKISVGFPGYIKKGVIQTAPNLGTGLWKDVCFGKLITDALNKPVRIANDADMQGLGVVSESGLEMVITLGTGFGSALFMNGYLLPHFELAHHPVSRSKTYDDYIGNKALKNVGKENGISESVRL